MVDQFERIAEAVRDPETVVATIADETTPVISKFLLVVVKQLTDDAFVLTAFFNRREKKGKLIWKT